MRAEIDLSNGGGALKRLADIFYPNRCPFCDSFIPYDRLCCTECFDSVLWTDEYICPKCGKYALGKCICPVECERTFTAAYYEETAKHGIYEMKFDGHKDAAVIFGKVIADRMAEQDALEGIDLAVPVPMSPSTLRRRGFNQAELIARAITAHTDIPIHTDILGRKEHSADQHTLSAEERIQAAAEQYYLKGSVPEGAAVLLVDDVLTTGSTMRVCTSLLLKGGAGRVICAAAVTVR